MSYPIIEIIQNDPLDDVYVDEESYISVKDLIALSRYVEPFNCPIAALDISGAPWDECNLLGLADHVRRVNEADLSIPIILDNQGRIADGRHRVIKAIMQGKTTIPAKRIMSEMRYTKR